MCTMLGRISSLQESWHVRMKGCTFMAHAFFSKGLQTQIVKLYEQDKKILRNEYHAEHRDPDHAKSSSLPSVVTHCYWQSFRKRISPQMDQPASLHNHVAGRVSIGARLLANLAGKLVTPQLRCQISCEV